MGAGTRWEAAPRFARVSASSLPIRSFAVTHEPSSLRRPRAVAAVKCDGIQVTKRRSSSWSNAAITRAHKRAPTLHGERAQSGPFWRVLTFSRQSVT